MELGTFRQLKSQFRCGIQLDISWLALDKLSNFNGVQYGLFAVINVCWARHQLLCHYYVTRGTQNVLCVRDVFGPHFQLLMF